MHATSAFGPEKNGQKNMLFTYQYEGGSTAVGTQHKEGMRHSRSKHGYSKWWPETERGLETERHIKSGSLSFPWMQKTRSCEKRNNLSTVQHFFKSLPWIRWTGGVRGPSRTCVPWSARTAWRSRGCASCWRWPDGV